MPYRKSMCLKYHNRHIPNKFPVEPPAGREQEMPKLYKKNVFAEMVPKESDQFNFQNKNHNPEGTLLDADSASPIIFVYNWLSYLIALSFCFLAEFPNEYINPK